jgi:hypothetical protein
VAFVPRKSKGKTETPAPKASGRAQRLALFGPPPLIEGEDVAAYEHLRARICATKKPVDIIDEIFIDDTVSYQWQISRERRLKSSLLQARGLEALERFVAKQLDNYADLYRDSLLDRLAEILQDLLGGGEPGPTLRERWRPSVSRKKWTLSTRSKKFSPASA